VEYYVVGGAGGYAADTGYEYASYATDSGGESYAADQSDSDGEGVYEVQSGDTLTGIAAELGTSVEELAADNGITDVDFLSVGQTLYY
jgi:LysM repeat protein